MVTFEYVIKDSKRDGLGLFTKSNIKKGVVCVIASPKLDQEFTEQEFARLHQIERQEIIHYGYKDRRTKTYKLDFDVPLRFLNHSADSNISQDIGEINTRLIAIRDIRAGEEIVWNYIETMDLKFFEQGFSWLPQEKIKAMIDEAQQAIIKRNAREENSVA